MLGNLFEERNWLLPKDYLVTENKKEDTTIDIPKPPLKEEAKMGEQASNQKEETGNPIVLFVKPKRKMGKINSSRSPYQSHKPKDPIL